MKDYVTHCLISKVVVTEEQVDIYYVLPFEFAPQVCQSVIEQPEGTPGHIYRLRLAGLHVPLVAGPGASVTRLIAIVLAKLATPLANGLIRHDHATFKQQLFDITEAQTEPEV
jgi:hypothetical protein